MKKRDRGYLSLLSSQLGAHQVSLYKSNSIRANTEHVPP